MTQSLRIDEFRIEHFVPWTVYARDELGIKDWDLMMQSYDTIRSWTRPTNGEAETILARYLREGLNGVRPLREAIELGSQEAQIVLESTN